MSEMEITQSTLYQINNNEFTPFGFSLGEAVMTGKKSMHILIGGGNRPFRQQNSITKKMAFLSEHV